MRALLASAMLTFPAFAGAQIAYNAPSAPTFKALDGATVNGKIHVQLGQTTGGPWSFTLDGQAKNIENSAPFVLANEAGNADDANLWDTLKAADGAHIVIAKNASQTLTARFTIANSATPPPPTLPGVTGEATVSWTYSTAVNLAGFRIYFGADPDALGASVQIANPAARSGTVSPLAAGTWYFAVTAYTSDGAESIDSAVVSKVITGDTTPPPTCTSPQPPSETQLQTCPAGTTGTWSQTRTYASAVYPQCWTAGPWVPTSAPAGACVMPETWVVAKNGTQLTRPAYEAVLPLTGTVLVRGNNEGSVPVGKTCGPELFKQSTNSYRQIAEADATLSSPTYKGRQHVALCIRQ